MIAKAKKVSINLFTSYVEIVCGEHLDTADFRLVDATIQRFKSENGVAITGTCVGTGRKQTVEFNVPFFMSYVDGAIEDEGSENG